jgi:hypothetical protein
MTLRELVGGVIESAGDPIYRGSYQTRIRGDPERAWKRERRPDRARGFEKSSLEPVARTKWRDREKH